MLPAPVRIDTLIGYLDWRLLCFMVARIRYLGPISASEPAHEERGWSISGLLPGSGRALPITRVLCSSHRGDRDRRDAAVDPPRLSANPSHRETYSPWSWISRPTLCCYASRRIAHSRFRPVLPRGIAAALTRSFWSTERARAPHRWVVAIPLLSFERSRPLTTNGALTPSASERCRTASCCSRSESSRSRTDLSGPAAFAHGKPPYVFPHVTRSCVFHYWASCDSSASVVSCLSLAALSASLISISGRSRLAHSSEGPFLRLFEPRRPQRVRLFRGIICSDRDVAPVDRRDRPGRSGRYDSEGSWR